MSTLRFYFMILVAVALSVATTACDSSDEPVVPPTRTILVYMEANNNLSSYAGLDIEEMKDGMRAKAAAEISGRLLVFKSLPGATPRLVEITDEGEEVLLKIYDRSISSVSIQRMREVLADVKAVAPATEYGLVLWSHASGWLNDSGVIEESEAADAAEPAMESMATLMSPLSASTIRPLSFGADGSGSIAKKMKLTSLAKALEGNTFSFIYFDCCHMSTVEVAYELRNLTQRIVGSAAELGVYGMPYDENLPLLFQPTPNLEKAVQNTFDSYDTGSPQSYGCTISLLNTKTLDRLAELSLEVFKRYRVSYAYQPVKYFRTIVMRSGIYDMYHLVDAICTDEQLLAEWKQAFADVVTVHLTTSTVYMLDATDFHGLGCQIIFPDTSVEQYGFDETAWFADVMAPALAILSTAQGI